MRTYPYAAIKFKKDEISYWLDFVNKRIGKEYFYKSKVIKSINGDVTNKLHLTLLYGFNDPSEYVQIRKYLNSIKINSVSINKPALFNGFNELYKILVLEVDDSGNKLIHTRVDLMGRFSYEPSVQHYKFKPHVTLAYVDTNFELDESFTLGIKSTALQIDSLELRGV